MCQNSIPRCAARGCTPWGTHTVGVSMGTERAPVEGEGSGREVLETDSLSTSPGTLGSFCPFHSELGKSRQAGETGL